MKYTSTINCNFENTGLCGFGLFQQTVNGLILKDKLNNKQGKKTGLKAEI